MVDYKKHKVSKTAQKCPCFERRNIKRMMRRIFLILAFLIALIFAASGCSPKVIYVKGDTEVIYRDSIVTKIDSVEVPLPVEKVVEVAFDYAPLHLETSLAEADIVADTTNRVLRGEMRNKQKSLPIGVPTTEQYHSRDSVQIKEVPVPYEVVKYKTPKWCWWVLGIAVLLLAMEVLKIFMERRIF